MSRMQFVRIAYYTATDGGTWNPCLIKEKVRVPRHVGADFFMRNKNLRANQCRAVVRNRVMFSFIDDRGFRWDCINGWTGHVGAPRYGK